MSDQRKLPTQKHLARFCVVIAILVGIFGTALWYFQIFSLAQFFIRAGIVLAGSFTLLHFYPRFLKHLESKSVDPRSPLYALPNILMVCWTYFVFLIMVVGTRVAFTMSGMWAMPPVVIGVSIIGAGLMRRVGDSRHCPHCEYLFAFEKEEEAPIRCPECGKGWLGILKTGRKVRSFKLVFLGLAFGIFATACLNPIFYISSLARYLPTPLLFASSYLLPTNSHVAWDELAARKLDPYWTSVMAKRVLSLRKSNPFNTSTRWFEQNAAANTIAPDLQERFFEEGFETSLIAPEHAQINNPFTVALRVSHLASGNKNQTGVLFAGYYLDNNLTPIGRSDKTLWAFELRPDVFSSSRDCLEQPITITTPGEHTIRVVYWVVYLPSFNDPLKWQPDGTPAPIPAALWMKRYEFTRTITVKQTF